MTSETDMGQLDLHESSHRRRSQVQSDIVESTPFRQKVLGVSIMVASLVIGAVGIEQSFEQPHSIDSTLVVGALIGLLIGREVATN